MEEALFTQKVEKTLLTLVLAVVCTCAVQAQTVLSTSRVGYNQHLYNGDFDAYRKFTVDFAANQGLGLNRIAVWPFQWQQSGHVLDPHLSQELLKQVRYVRSKGQKVYINEMPFYPKDWTGFPRNGQFCANGVCTDADVNWHCLPNNNTPYESWKDPDCRKDGQVFPLNPEHFAARRTQFLTALVELLKDDIDYIGFTNEPFFKSPNGTRIFTQMTPQMLLDLVIRPGYEITKAINPALQVVGPDEDDPESLAMFFRMGAGKYWDVISVHAYPWPNIQDFKTLMQEYDPVIRKYAEGKEVWLTELGEYDNPVQGYIWSEMLNDIRRYPWVKKIFPIVLMDEPAHPSVAQSGLVKHDGTPKASWGALKAYIDSFPLRTKVEINMSLDGWFLSDLNGKPGYSDYVTIQSTAGHAVPVRITIVRSDDSSETWIEEVFQRKNIEIHTHVHTAGEEVSMAVQVVNSEDLQYLYVEHSLYWGQGWQAGTNTGASKLGYEWSFAEGAISSEFTEWLTVFNPNPVGIYVDFEYLDQFGRTTVRTVYIPGGPGRVKFKVNDTLPGYAGGVAVKVCGRNPDGSQALIAAERLMTWWSDAREGHAEAGLTPATEWYGAEGHKGTFFTTFILVANTTDQEALIEVRFLMDNGQDYSVQVAVPAKTRYNQEPLVDMPVGGFGYFVRSKNGVPVVVERAMYWGESWEGGHVARASTKLAYNWSLAEGVTGGPFRQFILLANPGDSPASVSLSFLTQGGAIVNKEVIVPSHGRTTVCVNDVPGMEAQEFSTKIQSNQLIVVERAVYWNDLVDGRSMVGGHASLAVAR